MGAFSGILQSAHAHEAARDQWFEPGVRLRVKHFAWRARHNSARLAARFQRRGHLTDSQRYALLANELALSEPNERR